MIQSMSPQPRSGQIRTQQQGIKKGMAFHASLPTVGKRRKRRRSVMSEINVTPMVDVMLVLLIIFMVSAPLLTVGVPIDLPTSQAKSIEQDKEPLTISVNDAEKIFLQNSEISFDDLLPKLQAVAAGARRHRGAHLCARRQEGELRYDDEGDGPAFVGRLPSGWHWSRNSSRARNNGVQGRDSGVRRSARSQSCCGR